MIRILDLGLFLSFSVPLGGGEPGLAQNNTFLNTYLLAARCYYHCIYIRKLFVVKPSARTAGLK